MFIYNEDLTVLFTKLKFIQLQLNETADLPHSLFSLQFWWKIQTSRIAKNPKLFYCSLAYVKTLLTSADVWRNKICIMLRLNIVDDVNVKIKTVLIFVDMIFM